MEWIKDLDTSKENFFVSFEVQMHEDNSNPFQWLETVDGHGFSIGGKGLYFYSEVDAIQFALRWA